LLVGALLFCGCFVMGTSNAYREVFVLLALPALLRFGADPSLPRPIRLTAWLTVLAMWGSFPALLCDIWFGKLGPHGGPVPTFAFWAVREAVWWWLFVVLMAALFARAGLEAIVDTHSRTKPTAPSLA
jgi:hypothetical protein